MKTLTAPEGKYLTDGLVFVTELMYEDRHDFIPYRWTVVDSVEPRIDNDTILRELEEVLRNDQI